MIKDCEDAAAAAQKPVWEQAKHKPADEAAKEYAGDAKECAGEAHYGAEQAERLDEQDAYDARNEHASASGNSG